MEYTSCTSFKNGYEEGLWELAVIYGRGINDFKLDYSTPITDDVLGRLTDEEVDATLALVENLPPIKHKED